MRSVDGTIQLLMIGRRCAVEGYLAHPPGPPFTRGGKNRGQRLRDTMPDVEGMLSSRTPVRFPPCEGGARGGGPRGLGGWARR